MSLPALAAIGTFFGTTGGTALLGFAGSIIGGIGQGMMEKSRLRAEEKAKIDEEKRAEDRYAGAGDAMAFWDNGAAEADASIAAPYTEPHKKSTTALGNPQQLPPGLGQKYKKPEPPRGFNGLVTS